MSPLWMPHASVLADGDSHWRIKSSREPLPIQCPASPAAVMNQRRAKTEPSAVFGSPLPP